MELEKKNISLIISKVCSLRILTKYDVSEDYVLWMNDYEVTKYTEQKHIKHNKKNVEEFVDQKLKSDEDFLFGIYFEGGHIGNIKLGPIKWEHKSAEVSYFIGSREYWGKGIASSAVSKALDFGINDLGLEKINASYYEPNVASAKVLQRCNFEIEGRRISDVILEGVRVNSVLVGYVKNL